MVPGEGGLTGILSMAELTFGYARVSTVDQDLTAQRGGAHGARRRPEADIATTA